MRSFPLLLAVALFLGAPVGAEKPYEEAPDDEKPSYSRLANEIETHFKDKWNEEDGKAVAMQQALNRLEATEGFGDLHNYQILKTEDGKKTIVNIELSDGRSIFFDPEKGELVEFDPKNPGKLTPLKPDGAHVRRADKEQTDTAAFMKDYKGATKKMIVGGATGRFFFDGQETAYGSAAPKFGPGGKPVAGDFYDAPKRMVVTNAPGAKEAPEQFGEGDTHYWVGKQLFYRGENGGVKVGYMASGTEGKVIFYHGGAFPPDTETGNHSKQKEYWSLYSVADGKQPVKLGRYHEVIRTWSAEKIKGEGADRRLDISEHHRTITNVPVSRESGDNRAILRKVNGKYYRDTKIAKAELYDYGAPVQVGKERLQRFVDRSTGDLYAEHLVHGAKRLVRTGRQAADYTAQAPKKETEKQAVVLPEELRLPPAPEIEPEKKAELSRVPRGLDNKVPEDVAPILGRIFPKGPESGAPGKGYSWYQDARRALGAKDAKPIMKSELDLLIHTFQKSDDDVLRAKAAIALGTVARMSGSSAYHEEVRQALVRALVNDRNRPLVRNTVSGIPSYQEAAAHSLLRMGEFRTLVDWAAGAKGKSTEQVLQDPTALWSAYVLAAYTRDLAYSQGRNQQFLAYPVTDPKDSPAALLRSHMGDYAAVLNAAEAGFENRDDMKWRVRENLTRLQGAERRFQYSEQHGR